MIPNHEIPIAGGLNVALPKMALVRQRFDDSRLDDVGQAVGEQMPVSYTHLTLPTKNEV